MMMFACAKQQLSNIWGSIHESTEAEFINGVCYYKEIVCHFFIFSLNLLIWKCVTHVRGVALLILKVQKFINNFLRLLDFSSLLFPALLYGLQPVTPGTCILKTLLTFLLIKVGYLIYFLLLGIILLLTLP